MAVDKVAGSYVLFIAANACLVALVIGFFAGTGQVHSGMQPCMEKLIAHAKFDSLNGNLDHWEIRDCRIEFDRYIISNSDGPWFKKGMPCIGVALGNIVIFLAFWTARVFNLRGRDVLTQEQQFKIGAKSAQNSLTVQEEMPSSDKAGLPSEMLGAPQSFEEASAAPCSGSAYAEPVEV